MERFNKLIEILTLLKVDFELISSTEIILTCPCDKTKYFSKASLPMLDIINDPTVGCISDEVFIHIMYNKECDSLDWLIVDYDEYD